MATLATVDAARVGPRLLETEDSGRALPGHYHSGIYRDSHLNRLINNTRNHSFLNRGVQPWTHPARASTPDARGEAPWMGDHSGATVQRFRAPSSRSG